MYMKLFFANGVYEDNYGRIIDRKQVVAWVKAGFTLRIVEG